MCGFTRAHVSEYSPAFLSGDMNTLSVTFSVSSDLTTNPTSRLSMLIVAIQGLVKTETADSDEFSAISRGNTPIHSAVWKQGSGALYLLVNATLLGKTPYEFDMSMKVVNRFEEYEKYHFWYEKSGFWYDDIHCFFLMDSLRALACPPIHADASS